MQRQVVKRIIDHAITNAGPGYNLEPLIKACLKLEDGLGLEIDLWAMHHLMRPYLLDPHVDDGDVLAGVLTTFLLASSRNEFVDDPRCLANFPLIKIHTKWIHDTHLPVPITRLTQRGCWDLLIGLDWFVMSDVFASPNRGEDLIFEIKQLFALLQTRLFYLVHGNSFDLSIVDMKDDRDTEDMYLGESIDTTEVDYASDKEDGVVVVTAAEPAVSRGETITVANVGLRFLYNLESIVSHFHVALKRSDEHAACDIADVSWLKIGAFRKYLESMLRGVDEAWLVRSRMDWQHALQVHSGQKRMFRRINGIGIRTVRPRQVIVNLNDGLITQGHISKNREMFARLPGMSKEEHQASVRISTDAMFWAVSEQTTKMLRSFFPRRIWRDRVRNRWMVRAGDDSVLSAPSMTHCFFVLRHANLQESSIDGVDVSAYDAFVEGARSE